MQTKYCSKCKTEKSVSEFNKNRSRKDGLQSSCRECKKKYCKDHYNKNKEYYLEKNRRCRERSIEWYNEFKKTLECKECGERHISCLEFHHRNPEEKEFCVSLFIRQNISIKRVKEEIEKCDVLCSNCHRKLHWEENHDAL